MAGSCQRRDRQDDRTVEKTCQPSRGRPFRLDRGNGVGDGHRPSCRACHADVVPHGSRGIRTSGCELCGIGDNVPMRQVYSLAVCQEMAEWVRAALWPEIVNTSTTSSSTHSGSQLARLGKYSFDCANGGRKIPF